jgi:class 3 adenylate cyclase/tetratricopeptide (TPR) repeat protein
MARDVNEWLEGLGLGEYTEAFAENGVDISLLSELTNEDLKDLGVERLVDRKTILKAIARIAESEDEPTAEPPAPTIIAGERRQVTVLFSDIVGYTKLSSKLDAEETHALLNRYFEAVDSIIESYDGSVDKHIGDNVMAVFGAPIAHDDDPLRAVRAALDIHEALATLSDDDEHILQAHIGIASGQVVASGTGSDAHREYTVTGDSVNLASRLQDRAAPGETLVSDTLRRAVGDVVVCTALGEVEVKGLDVPVPVWRVAAFCDKAEQVKRDALVGRRAELRQFTGAIEACLETGRGEAIVVRGEAGIGKTRLVEEFAALASVHGFTSHKGLVLDFGVGKGQDAIPALVRGLIGIPPGAGKAVRHTAAETALVDGLLTADQRVFLNDLLDLPQPVEDRAMYDAMDNATRNEGKRDVVADLIRAVSGRSPILVIVEDVHWANPITLIQLASMTATVAECQAVLVMTSRVEGDPLDQAWRGSTHGSPLLTIDLGPLHEVDAIVMAGAFVDASTQFAKGCIERAEGNPLFLEQLLRSGKERDEEDIPASIQSLVLARMDRLPASDKPAVQAASVIGKRFSPYLLNHLLGTDRYDCENLVRQNLVRVEGSGFLFTHALIQEGVYGSLLKQQRQALHRKCAEWFSEHDLVLHAEHLDHADDPSAADAYLEAAREQAAQYRFEQAMSLTDRGLARTEKGPVQHRLRCLKGELLHELDDVGSSIAVFQEALDQASDDLERCEAWMGLAAGMRVTTDFQGALELLAYAEPIAVRHNLTKQLSRLHHLRGNLFYTVGEIAGCWEQHQLALEFALKAGSPEDEARALAGLGDAEYARGRMRSAYESLRLCVDRCREIGSGRVEVANRSQMANAFLYLGATDAVLAGSCEAVEAAAKVGHHRAEMNALCGVCNVAVELGDSDLLGVHAERALALAQRLQARGWEPLLLSYSAWAHHLCGERGQAYDLLEHAMANEAAMAFGGGWPLGMMSVVTDNPDTRRRVLRDGKALLSKGSNGASNFHFYRHAINACCQSALWEELEQLAQGLEDYTRDEPLPWSNFCIARGKALASVGRGECDDSVANSVTSLLGQATRMGYKASIPALNDALSRL